MRPGLFYYLVIETESAKRRMGSPERLSAGARPKPEGSPCGDWCSQYSLSMSIMMSVAFNAYSRGIVRGGMKRNTLP